jgi:putative glycosyltransferase (TIGR04348 family)
MPPSSKPIVGILNPTPPRVRGGNRTTALRWARLFRSLGMKVFLEERWSGRPCDLLVALNAWKSGDSIGRFRTERPDTPLVVAITGTDLFTDAPEAAALTAALDSATRLVVLIDLARDALAARHRAKTVVIHQSVRPLEEIPAPRSDFFEVVTVANLRPVKDPLLVARAARLLPATSRIQVRLIGGTLDPRLRREVEEEVASNPRLRWRGEQTRLETLRRVASARALVSPSRAEGGAGVVSEGLAHGVPILATAIPGSVGMLSEDHPGLFPVGDAPALAALLHRLETDRLFGEELARRSRDLAWITEPDLEERRWKALLADILPGA